MPGPNLIQVRRTSVADREANTITLPDAGTLALNILDGRMFSTNGAAVFEVGANTKNCRVSNSFFVGDGSVNTSANSTQINTSITQLSTALYVGDNVDITIAGWFLGNTTVNVFANSTTIKLANSTVNTHISVPDTTAYSATNYFLHANGSWVQVVGGGGSARVYQAYTATAAQDTFTVSGGYTIGQIDVFENGVHLSNTEYVQNGTTVVLNSPALVGELIEVAGWIAMSSFSPTAGGSDSYIQYNDGGPLGGISTFTFNDSTSTVTVGSSTVNLIANSTTLKLANSTVNTAIVVPTAAQYAGNYYLHANGTWQLVSSGATPGGSDTYVQFNDGGASLNGTAGFTFTKSTNNAVIANTLTIGTATINSTNYSQTANNTTWHGTSIFANSTGAYPTSNSVGAVLGNTISRVIITGNSATFTSTLAAGDTTITGFVNATTSVNSALIKVGVDFAANTLGVFHTSFMNASAFVTSGFIANVTHIVPTSNSTGQNLGNTIARWVITANTIETSGLANLSALNVVNQTNTAALFATTSANVGANVQANTTTILVGNSTVNTVIGNTQIAIGNTTVNVVANSISIKLANSTVNTGIVVPTAAQYAGSYYLHANGTWSLVSAGATPAGANTEIQYNLSGALGANQNFTFDFNTGGLKVGNSTVNLIANSTLLKLANSTVNTGITIPSAADWAGSKFLHANGTWATPATGGGGAVSRVYQSYTATGGQTTYTVSGGYTVGQIEVFENGVHLANTEYTQDGSTVVLNVGSLVGAIIEVAGYKNVGDLTSPRVYQAFTATSGQTLFTLAAAYTADNIAVYYNGVHLAPTDYTQNAGAGTVTLANAANTGALIEVEGWNAMTTISFVPTPTGSNTWVQFNDSGVMGASDGLTFDDATNTVVVANTLTVASAFTANGLGTYHIGTINADSFTVGTAWTANSTLVNANALNCRNQVNTATLFVATTIDVGANVDLSTTQLFVGNSTTNTTLGNNYVDIGNTTVNVYANSTILKVANSTSIANLSPSTLTIGSTTVNSTVIYSAGSLLSANIQINPQTGTTYTLQASDSGKVVTCNNASAITVTVPAGLPIGFRTMVMQIAAGAVTLSNTGQTGANIFSRTAGFTTSSQWATASVSEIAANTYVIDGSI